MLSVVAMKVVNTLVPKLDVLESHLGQPIYVADERIEVRLVNFGTCYQLWLVPVRNAGEEKHLSIFRFNLFDQERRNGLTRRDFLHTLLIAHTSLTDIYRKAESLNWKRKGDGFEPVVFESQSLTIDREDRLGTDVFSPFRRLTPLTKTPATWTKELILRALVNGQVRDVRVLLGKDSNPGEVTTSTEAMTLAWAMVERWPEAWPVTVETDRVHVCCPHGRWWSTFLPDISP